MKVLIIEATAEELRANRTVLDTVTDALSRFSESLVGVRMTSDQVSAALASIREEEEGEQDE